ncbi:tyrosine--tRNA ligase, partial [Patescibacteria group bacterium]|nr:tyrosine--tRNA ligase [Patescibacteria group bacterium]
AIISGLELLTEVPIEDIEQIKAEIKNNANPMQFKKLMAYEIVKIVKGEKDAIKAQQHFEQTVQKKELSNKVKSQKLKVKSQNIIDLLTQIKLASSKNEARRLIQQNGIKIDGKVVSDINYQVNVTKQGVLVQRGKRQFVKVNNF